jgi:hypothetical protein
VKYSSAKTKEICQYLEEGLSREDAWTLVGIVKSTFYEWMEKSDFSDSIKKAELKGKREHILNIKKAGEQHWTASAWFLERRYYEEFGNKSKLEHTGQGGGPILSIDLTKLETPESLVSAILTIKEIDKLLGEEKNGNE